MFLFLVKNSCHITILNYYWFEHLLKRCIRNFFCLFVSHLKLIQRRDETAEGWLKPSYCWSIQHCFIMAHYRYYIALLDVRIQNKSPPIIFRLGFIRFWRKPQPMFFVNIPSIILRPDKYNTIYKYSIFFLYFVRSTDFICYPLVPNPYSGHFKT